MLGFDHSEESDRFTLGSEQGEDIPFFDPAQIADINVIAAIVFPRLILQGDHLAADDPAVVI